MFPKKSQRQEPGRFSFKTLVGNWNEDLYEREYKTKASADKFEKRDSLLQYTESMLDFYLHPVQLETICERIKYGNVIQLCAPDFRNPKHIVPNYEDMPMVVSVHLHPGHVRRLQTFSDECDVSVAPSILSCRRNSFIIRSNSKINKAGEVLRYGDLFNLQLVEPDPEGHPLVLYSSLKYQNLKFRREAPQNYYKNGEINQTVGICARMDLTNVTSKCLQEVPPMHTYWKCLHLQPNMRFETEGEPVPSNQRIVIAHAATNKLMAAESASSHTSFGHEYGLSVCTYESVHKVQMDQNVWMLKTAEKN